MANKFLPAGQWYTIPAVYPELNEADVIRLFRENCGIELTEEQIRVNYQPTPGRGLCYGATICFSKKNVLDLLLRSLAGARLHGVPVPTLYYPMGSKATEWFSTND